MFSSPAVPDGDRPIRSLQWKQGAELPPFIQTPAVVALLTQLAAGEPPPNTVMVSNAVAVQVCWVVFKAPELQDVSWLGVYRILASLALGIPVSEPGQPEVNRLHNCLDRRRNRKKEGLLNDFTYAVNHRNTGVTHEDATHRLLLEWDLKPFEFKFIGSGSGDPSGDPNCSEHEVSTSQTVRDACAAREKVRLRIDVKRGLYFGSAVDGQEEPRCLRPRPEFKFIFPTPLDTNIGMVLPVASQEEYFQVKPSLQRGAGMGCFAKKDITAGTAFKLDVPQVMKNDGEADEREAEGAFFMSFSFLDNEEPNTNLIFDGELTTFSMVKDQLLPEAFESRVGMLAPEQPLNKANDLNYNAGMTRDAYLGVESYLDKNVGAFVLGVKDGLVTCAMVLTTRDVKVGDEFGIGYGYDFWSKHADLVRYAASLSTWERREMKWLLEQF